jgi:hypothetical protein
VDQEREEERELPRLSVRTSSDGLGNERPREGPRASHHGPAVPERQPRRRRSQRGWLLLGIAILALVVGIHLSHGLVIATGLVLAGIAAHLLDDADPPGPRPDRHPRW